MDLPVQDRQINIVYFRAKREHAPLILGFHGGGFLFGGNAMNDAMWSAVRDALDVNVASVEYRKSPDYRYKEALDDAYDAAVYMKNHAEEFGFDENRISVMGCSAGAGLAATVCLHAKEKGGVLFQNQILMYPFLDASTDPDSKGEGNVGGPSLMCLMSFTAHRRRQNCRSYLRSLHLWKNCRGFPMQFSVWQITIP
ncbi:MAG: alpha/beta hydrolase fold domain-containing protein [Eubacterium sp.]